MRRGEIFYTQHIARSPVHGKRPQIYRDKIIGICIGVAQKGARALTEAQFWRLVGATGLVSTTHLEECLGREAVDKMTQFIVDKFPMGGKKDEPVQDEAVESGPSEEPSLPAGEVRESSEGSDGELRASPEQGT